MATATQTRRAVLSYDQLKRITKDAGSQWPDLLVNDYQAIIQDFILLAGGIDAFDIRITKNEKDIVQLFEITAKNAEDITWLEYRSFGEARPTGYDESIDYLENEYVTYPAGDPQSYYICIEDTVAGAFDANQWAKVSLKDNRAYIDKTRQDVTDNFVLAGYGQIGLNVAVPLLDISVGVWQTLPMDVELISTPRYITQSLASNSLSFDVEGVWSVNIKVSLTFVDVNAGRKLYLRLYNLTTATPGATIFVEGVGRNTDAGGFSFTAIVSTDELTVGDEYVLQISGDSTFTSVESIGSVWGASHISEAKFL